MSDIHKASEDLDFVREALERARDRPAHPAIYALWGVICLAGMPLFDFVPRAGGIFFAVAAPLGGVLSAVIGARCARRQGQQSRERAWQFILHWAAAMVAVFGVVGLLISGAMPHAAAGRVILLIVALAYFMAGLYLDRVLAWLGLIMLACFLAMFVVTAHSWTITGIAVGGSMLAAALRGGRRGPAHV